MSVFMFDEMKSKKNFFFYKTRIELNEWNKKKVRDMWQLIMCEWWWWWWGWYWCCCWECPGDIDILCVCVCRRRCFFFDIHPRTKWWKLWTTIGPGYSFFRGDGGDIFICLICMCLSDFNLMNFFISWFGDPVVGCVCVCVMSICSGVGQIFFVFVLIVDDKDMATTVVVGWLIEFCTFFCSGCCLNFEFNLIRVFWIFNELNENDHTFQMKKFLLPGN